MYLTSILMTSTEVKSIDRWMA